MSDVSSPHRLWRVALSEHPTDGTAQAFRFVELMMHHGHIKSEATVMDVLKSAIQRLQSAMVAPIDLAAFRNALKHLQDQCGYALDILT